MVIIIVTFILTIFLIVFIFFTNNKKHFINVLKTLPRDLRLLYKYSRLNCRMLWYRYTNRTIDKLFLKYVQKHPFKVALQYQNEKWTFLEIHNYSNKIANLFLQKGFRKGESVAIFMESCPEFIMIWLGLMKIGVISALINTNLRKDCLRYCIDIAKCKAVIYSSETKNGIDELIADGFDMDKFYVKTTNEEVSDLTFVDIKKELINMPIEVKQENTLHQISDVITYVYTSGTTGLPKAAVFTHFRYILLATGVRLFIKLKDNDNVYTTLPLYHSAGSIGCVSLAIVYGLTVTIRKKFSASNFWKDCVIHNCTVAQYIGELCRYLLNAQVQTEYETKHKVRVMYGNGLKPQIWSQFVERFQIRNIGELYAATEGNAILINFDGVIGAVGFIPLFLRHISPTKLIKYDEYNEPVRNENGFCIKCEFNEPGLMIGKVSRNLTSIEFSGYLDKEETKKKLLHNVFEPNDIYFNTGDILLMNELGYFYFKDRVGDTFRWKGENVATSEVESCISKILNFEDVIVYGVEIPNTDGRAGMASIVDSKKSIKLEALANDLKANLPSYAVPIFIRIINEAPITGTFKLQKVELQKQGFDINSVNDELYVLDKSRNKYLRIDKSVYNDILQNKIKF